VVSRLSMHCFGGGVLLAILLQPVKSGAGPCQQEAAASTACSEKKTGHHGISSIETALIIEGDRAYRQHSAGLTPAPNCRTFFEFASRYVKKPRLPAKAAPKQAARPT
jgi:hypothetical protein